jgi:hypothetical protein
MRKPFRTIGLVGLMCVAACTAAKAQTPPLVDAPIVIHGTPFVWTPAMLAAKKPVSGQCHWSIGNERMASMTMHPMLLETMAHSHSEMFGTWFGEMWRTFRVDFAIVLFNGDSADGAYFGLYKEQLDQPAIHDIVWDDTGTDQPPSMSNAGAPNEVRTYRGHFMVDPPQRKGYFHVQLTVAAQFFNNDHTDESLLLPFYSMLGDVEVPGGDQWVISERCDAFTATRQDGTLGTTVAEFNNALGDPQFPFVISAPFKTHGFTAGYGAADLPPATFSVRWDMNLHFGDTGHLLQSFVGIDNLWDEIVLDPAVLGNGDKKIALIRNQPDGHSEVSGLIVVPLHVDTSFVPPAPLLCNEPSATNVGEPLPCKFAAPPATPLCTDPTATNQGQPAPCTFPPPPPAVAPLLLSGTYRLCDAGGTKCVELIVK